MIKRLLYALAILSGLFVVEVILTLTVQTIGNHYHYGKEAVTCGSYVSCIVLLMYLLKKD